jgi:uncharacterized damage-inducible protein DinB
MSTAHQGPSLEFITTYRDMMLQGLSREMETTKKVLAAVPDDKSDYRPDPHARTAMELAWHLANTDIQFLDGIADLNFKMESPEGENKPKTIPAMVEWYDKHFKRGVERVQAMTPAQLATPVNFYGVFNFPAAFYLGFLNNHCIHHRGELAVYLRPMGAKVPSIYGGSYDEPFQGGQEQSSAA